MGPMQVGGEIGKKFTWNAKGMWYRSGVTKGTMSEKTTALTIDASAVACHAGEITVYDENAFRIKEAEKNNIPWKKVVSGCQWCPGSTYVLNVDGKEASACTPCPGKGATCAAGGIFIRVNKRYWRAYW